MLKERIQPVFFCIQNNDIYRANYYFNQATGEGHISTLYNLALLNGRQHKPLLY